MNPQKHAKTRGFCVYIKPGLDFSKKIFLNK